MCSSIIKIIIILFYFIKISMKFKFYKNKNLNEKKIYFIKKYKRNYFLYFYRKIF